MGACPSALAEALTFEGAVFVAITFSAVLADVFKGPLLRTLARAKVDSALPRDGRWGRRISTFNGEDLPEILSLVKREPPVWELNVSASTPLSPSHFELFVEILARIEYTRKIGTYAMPVTYAPRLARLLPRFEHLETLSLTKARMTDAGVAVLGTVLPRLSKLKDLSLVDNEITDVGVAALGIVLPRLSTLERLCLAGNKITDVGARTLGNTLPVSNVYLSLSAPPTSDLTVSRHWPQRCRRVPNSPISRSTSRSTSYDGRLR